MAAIHTRTCISTVHISSGSPFNCKVGGTTGINEESMLTTQQRATDVTHVGSTCELSLKIPGMQNTTRLIQYLVTGLFVILHTMLSFEKLSVK